MARVKFGSIITDSRGKIAGTFLRLTHWGVQLNRAAQRKTQLTTRQLIQGAILGSTAPVWSEQLTETEREDWRALAATQTSVDQWGDTYPLTGIALFTRVNSQRIAAGLPILTTAPADQAVTAPLTATLTIGAGPTLSVAFTATPAPTNHRVKIWATAPMSQGTSVAQRRSHLLKISSVAAASPIDFTAEYLAIFGSLPAGKKVYCELAFWNQATGAQSPKLLTNDIF